MRAHHEGPSVIDLEAVRRARQAAALGEPPRPDWLDAELARVHDRMVADGLDQASLRRRRRWHALAAALCYAIAVGFLLFALFGRQVEQLVLGWWS